MSRNEVVIRFALPGWSRWRWLGVVGALGVLGAALAYAAPEWPYVAPTYRQGDPLSSANLTAQLAQVGDNLNDVDARIRALQTQLAGLQADPDCPRGYTRDASVTNLTVCKKGADEMVKVGSGLSAFWIDRYEASVWPSIDGTGTQYGTASDDYPATFPDNGQRVPGFTDLYAVSKAGVLPSASLTWFQAQQACRASGKRLPSDEEWLAAASGTSDPGANSGAGGTCVTNSGAGPRRTGTGSSCVSAWGAQDMIGNVWEWTAQWYAGLGNLNGMGGLAPAQTWPGTYNSDVIGNIGATTVYDGNSSSIIGLPAAAFRGGGRFTAQGAGIFALDLSYAPSVWISVVGFRCAVR